MAILHISGFEVLVDDEVAFDINPNLWECRETRGRPYFRSVCRKGGVRKTVWLHRIIALCPKGKEVDHVNNNPLDNRRINLRVCTQAQNLQNRGKRRVGTAKYKGAYWNKLMRKWHAQIYHGKKIHLGFFDNPEEAALAYNDAAIKYHGEFANLNNVGGVTCP